MTMNAHARRWVAATALAALAVTMVAPAADAGGKRGKHRGRSHQAHVVRYKPDWRPAHRSTHRVVHVHRSSDGSAVAGFLGGLVLGAILTSAADAHAAPPPPGYRYYDPYCDEHFGSLEIYRGDFRAHRHPRVARVIEVRTGDWVETLHYHDGAWRHWDERDDYDD